jgi:hypothetical protein
LTIPLPQIYQTLTFLHQKDHNHLTSIAADEETGGVCCIVMVLSPNLTEKEWGKRGNVNRRGIEKKEYVPEART